MIMADGNFSPAGPITHYNQVNLRIAGGLETYALDIAPLAHPILLGAPWLRRHSPLIDFKKRELTFISRYCRDRCGHHNKTIKLHNQDKPVAPCRPIDRGGNPGAAPTLTNKPSPKVAIVSAARFALACKQEGTELFFLSKRTAGMEHAMRNFLTRSEGVTNQGNHELEQGPRSGIRFVYKLG
jgi:hypothetical protein